jgi:hypothetical protein
MTVVAVRAAQPRAASPTPALAALTVVAGCIALVSRPISDAYIAITIAVGVAGLIHPIAVERLSRRSAGTWVAAAVIGTASFAIARGALGESLIPPPTGWLMLSGMAAAAAEEAFFRRLAYGTLLRWGVPAAIAGSSFAFAIVHVTVWGWRAFPIDLAAGLLLGWQRWVTGSWTASALTHVIANIVTLW